MFILKCYKEQLERLPQNLDIVLWERHPRESLSTFFRGSPAEKQKLEMLLDDTMAEYKIPYPMYSLPPYDLTKLEPVLFDAEFPIILYHADLYLKHEPCIYIFLICADAEVQLQRIIRRGRPSELSVYHEIRDLKDINDKYDHLLGLFGWDWALKMSGKISTKRIKL